MCDINDSDACFAALEPKLSALAKQFPNGGVYAYRDGLGTIHAQADTSYRVVANAFNRLDIADQSRGVLMRLTDEGVLCAF